ncbi:MAG: polysaccharide deacetylase family protein [Myxococcaceae bacterium]
MTSKTTPSTFLPRPVRQPDIDALVVGIVVISVGFGLWKLARARRWQVTGTLVWRASHARPEVALTLDDGPWPEHLHEVLDLLKARNVHATFFVTGQAIEANPSLLDEILAQNHELGNHSFSHKRMVLKGWAFVRDEVERTDALIRNHGVKGPIYFRPPFGKKLVILPLYLAHTGRTTVMWDVEASEDPSQATNAQSVCDYVLANVQPGSVLLFHPFGANGAIERKALPCVLDGIRQLGYRDGV